MTTTAHPLSAPSFEKGVPDGYFAHLRDEDPVHWTEGVDGSRSFWSVTRHADVVAATRDTATYSSQIGGSTTDDLEPGDLEQRRALIDTDPPLHTVMRKLVTTRFTPGAAHAQWGNFVDELVTETLDRVARRDDFDYVDEVASVIPIKVLGNLLGVPDDDLGYLMRLGDEMIASTDPDHAPRTALSPEVVAQHSGYPFSSPAGRELWEYAGVLRRRRSDHPGDDVFSQLIHATIEGRRLTARELDNFFSMFVVAGNETTRMALAHAMLAFAEFPAQFARLAAAPELLPTAVEEVLRWSTPIHHFRRTATRNTTLAGQDIAAGDKVVLWYISANRDDRVFSAPNEFDVARRPNPHLAFGGGGPHFCLGNSLARIEMKAVFSYLAARIDRVELTGEVRRLRSNFSHGIKELPIRLHHTGASV